MSQVDSQKILIIDAGCQFHGQGGTLNHAVAQMAKDWLTDLGHQVTITTVDREFDPAEEAQKLVDADSVIIQFPGWWMSYPWQLKRYIDEVFMMPAIRANDGRSHTNHTKLYGRGGFLQGKTYMVSSTWNAPAEAFTNPLQFFEGKGIDGVTFPLHKAFQFIGFKALPSFSMHDVVKNPTHEEDFAHFKAHLLHYYG